MTSAAPVVGVGVDLVEVERIRRALARTPGFARRVFTDGERARAEAARSPAERYAVRWAAKEAVLKVLGVGIGAVPLRSIEVVRADSGAPGIVLGADAAALGASLGIAGWLVSLTHTAQLAQATVLGIGVGGATGDPVAGRPGRGRSQPAAGGAAG